MAQLQQLRDAFDAMRAQIARVVIGQDAVVEELLIALFGRGTASWWACPDLPRLACQHAIPHPVALVQAHPVHAGPDAG